MKAFRHLGSAAVCLHYQFTEPVVVLSLHESCDDCYKQRQRRSFRLAVHYSVGCGFGRLTAGDRGPRDLEQ